MSLKIKIIIKEISYKDREVHDNCKEVQEISLTYKSPKEQDIYNIPIVFNNKGEQCFLINNMMLNNQQEQTYLKALTVVHNYFDSLRNCYINIFWLEAFARLSCIKEMVYGSLNIIQCLATFKPYLLDSCITDFSVVLDLDKEKPALLYNNSPEKLLSNDPTDNVLASNINDTIIDPNSLVT